MKTALIFAALLTCVLSATIVFSQNVFPASTFEYQEYTEHSGTIVFSPYPRLIENGTPYLLAGQGKHGWEPSSGVGGVVSLKGALIHRHEGQMLEVSPGSEQMTGNDRQDPAETSLGEVELRGEIVDTKCFLGVMNPGNGKVHRECAARCISGGLPPGFLVKDADGETRVLLIMGRNGRKLNRELLNYVAEPIRLHGELVRSAGSLLIKTEPRDFIRE